MVRLKKVSLDNFQLVRSNSASGNSNSNNSSSSEGSVGNSPLLLKSVIKYLPNLRQLSILRHHSSQSLH